MNDVPRRMRELMLLIDQSIQLTDDTEELLMLACAMMQRTREIFDSTLGETGRKDMFAELTK